MHKILLAAIALGVTIGSVAEAGTDSVYPAITQEEHADPSAAKTFKAFFAAKSQHNVGRTMSFFSPGLVTYTDATLGWPLDGFGAVKKLFDTYMPKWPPSGLSYPARILGGPNSALVEFIDTKELFGSELRIFGAVDFANGKVVRWVDYWDGNTYELSGYQQLRTPADKFPTDFKEQAVGENATNRMKTVATTLQKALAGGDAKAAAALFSYEGVFEDRTLRSKIVGQAAIERYLSRALDKAPFGKGSKLRHVVGGDRGGGFEWVAVSSSPSIPGVAALELDSDGKITNFAAMYDGRLISADRLKSLAALSLE